MDYHGLSSDFRALSRPFASFTSFWKPEMLTLKLSMWDTKQINMARLWHGLQFSSRSSTESHLFSWTRSGHTCKPLHSLSLSLIHHRFPGSSFFAQNLLKSHSRPLSTKSKQREHGRFHSNYVTVYCSRHRREHIVQRGEGGYFISEDTDGSTVIRRLGQYGLGAQDRHGASARR